MSNYKLPKIEELLDAGVHFGHQVRRWNPEMEKYIYAARKGIHVIDLQKTHEELKKACEFLYETASKGGQIVFVGTKRQARDIIELEANRCGALHVTERWLGGTMTNYNVIKKNLQRYVDLQRQREAGELDKYTKKERLLIDREIAKLQRSIGGIVSLKGTPAAVFVVDGRREKTVIKEANMKDVPVVALLDTNSDPRNVDYVIAGNDDAIKSIATIVRVISDAVEEGYKEFAKNGGLEHMSKENMEKDQKSKNAVKSSTKKAAETTSKAEAKEEVKKEAQVTSSQSPASTKKAGKKAIKQAEEEVEVPSVEEDLEETAKEAKKDAEEPKKAKKASKAKKSTKKGAEEKKEATEVAEKSETTESAKDSK